MKRFVETLFLKTRFYPGKGGGNVKGEGGWE